MKHFSTVGAWGTLLPYSSGFRLRIPSWVALVAAIPLLALAGLATIARSLPLQLLFGVPGSLFGILWAMSRRVSMNFGLIRINRETREAIFTDRDGSEQSVQFGRFLSIKIERVITGKTYSWRAVLCGTDGNLVLETGSFQSRLAKWISPIANWLNIPVSVSREDISGIEWLLTPQFRTNPYPNLTSQSPGSTQKTSHVGDFRR